MNATPKIHKFEEAGLGKYPYKFIGVQSQSDRAQMNREREANGQIYTTNHCTSCDYCSTAIHDAFYLESADGKRFKVGCDCILKYGDSGLRKLIEPAKKEHDRKKRRAAADKREAAALPIAKQAMESMGEGSWGDWLRAKPHPYEYYAKRGSTLWDYWDFCGAGKNGPNSVKFVKMLQRAVADNRAENVNPKLV